MKVRIGQSNCVKLCANCSNFILSFFSAYLMHFIMSEKLFLSLNYVSYINYCAYSVMSLKNTVTVLLRPINIFNSVPSLPPPP